MSSTYSTKLISMLPPISMCAQDFVGTKGVSQNHLLSFDDNKVLKIINWILLNICSSVQDHNQSTIHKDSDWTSQRAKELYLKLRASEKMRLKKCVWRTASEERAPEDTSSEVMVIRSISPEATSPELTKYSVRSVQPLNLRTPLQPPSLQLVSTSRQE